MGVLVILLILIVIVHRSVHLYTFLKLISRLCNIYDRNYLNEHGDEHTQLIVDYMDKNHRFKSDWSAYRWLFLEGPNQLMMFFSTKPLTIEDQYGLEVVGVLEKYYVFEDYELEKNEI